MAQWADNALKKINRVKIKDKRNFTIPPPENFHIILVNEIYFFFFLTMEVVKSFYALYLSTQKKLYVLPNLHGK